MKCTDSRECDPVSHLMFSQEGAPQTHQSILKISSNVGIHRLPVGPITPP